MALGRVRPGEPRIRSRARNVPALDTVARRETRPTFWGGTLTMHSGWGNSYLYPDTKRCIVLSMIKTTARGADFGACHDRSGQLEGQRWSLKDRSAAF